ncbi:MAG: glycosyltransferase [Dolichospermum sp. DET50]|nr:glycosyltransferase [Dolichospermum sp. DET66]MBS3032035.1 glycosyltransferase [Dolichospermum sp. DET67]MBS3037244.1 glycosyltransferase [Dolichospermum sp. DET50]QSX69232.1 MAG: glycosyltransferase [Dolichospermum sp. DET69]
MSEQHPDRATILPVPEGIPRPLWSVMIPTYNCANYLRETLASVLAQDPGSEVMQIEVVDDHSTKDDPEAVVRELAGDRVSFYRQPENVGYIKNFETCLQRSRGQLIHLLHGDDCLRETFYYKMQQIFEKYPDIGAAFCRHIYMSKEGHWKGISDLEQTESGILNKWLEKIAACQRLTTPSIVVRREVYEKLGGFDCRITCAGEDWEMWVRIATQYLVAYEVEPLAIYRQERLGALTENTARTGKLVRDMRLATEIIGSYLPEYLPSVVTSKLLNQAREKYARWAIRDARRVGDLGDMPAVITQAKEALKCSRSLKTIHLVSKLLLKEGARFLWRTLGIKNQHKKVIQ